MPVRDLLCLANSPKRGGRCVAGLRTDGGGWMRLVSGLPDGPLLPPQYTLPDGSCAQLLDVLRVPIAGPKPGPHHPEDWLLADGAWRLLARPLPDSALPLLQGAVERGSELLRGHGDHVPFDEFRERPAQNSLSLIAPRRLFLYALTDAGKTRIRGRFQLGPRRTWYDLAVTDPTWHSTIARDQEQDLFQVDQPFVLTISLGEPYQRLCFKLIAAVIAVPFDVG